MFLLILNMRCFYIDSKRSKIEELLSYIEERLEELEEEKEELKNFQDMDRERRCLEYTIYHREQTDLLQQLQEVRFMETFGSTDKQVYYHTRYVDSLMLNRLSD